MNLSKSFLLIPAASLLFAAAVGSGACSSSASVGLAVGTAIPPGDTFAGDFTVGEKCSGEYDIAAATGTGFLVCYDDAWTYSASDPGSSYTPDPGVGDDSGSDAGDDSGDDSSPDAGDDSGDDTGSDAGDDSGDDTGSDAGDDAADDSGDDATQGDDAMSDDSGATSDDSGGDDAGDAGS